MQLRPNTAYPESDPRYHTANIKATLHDLIEHRRRRQSRRAQSASFVRNGR
jgi:hypothetical protein